MLLYIIENKPFVCRKLSRIHGKSLFHHKTFAITCDITKDYACGDEWRLFGMKLSCGGMKHRKICKIFLPQKFHVMHRLHRIQAAVV